MQTAGLLRRRIYCKFANVLNNRIIYNTIENVCCLRMKQNYLPYTGVQIRNYSDEPVSFKSVVHNFYQAICSKQKNNKLQPSLTLKNIAKKTHPPEWKAKLSLTWPKEVTFEGTGKQKSEAQNKVYKEATLLLQKMKLLSEAFKPQLTTKEEIRTHYAKQRAPFPLNVNAETQQEMEEYLKNMSENVFEKEETTDFDEESSHFENKDQVLFDIMTGRPYEETIDDFKTEGRDQNLFNRRKMWKNTLNPDLIEIQNATELLPIMEFREKILHLLRENQIVVLSGETGCGKTTQVPQFIFDEYIEKHKGSQCNIVVTQPRRLSAIAISARVAKERGEELRESVGYQVRLDSMRPYERGGILYCSTGVLLRQLQDNPNLEGISHVIIDEAHERDVFIDFLLVLLKDLATRNKSLRILIMSASMNVEKFSSYFNNCPTIDVPGRIFPVVDYYLDEIEKLIGYKRKRLAKRPGSESVANFDSDLIVETIRWIDGNRPEGAILCFLPGWQEIKSVMDGLQSLFPDTEKHLIYPVHSTVTNKDQYAIFNKPPEGVRKIILATNIAETSITINDVVYVVDSGLLKETVFNPEWGTATLMRNFVSKANVKQRKGRAGRTKPGECYHLYPQRLLNEMKEFPVPEIQRISLENVVLNTKTYLSDYKHAKDFLSRCLDPPSLEAIEDSICDLQERGFLTYDEKLTTLGQCVTQFALHPYLGKAVLYALWLRCLDPVLTIVAYLTAGKEPMMGTMEDRDKIREVKLKFANQSDSDHIAISRIFHVWLERRTAGRLAEYDFCQENLVHYSSMKFIWSLKESLQKQIDELFRSQEDSYDNIPLTSTDDEEYMVVPYNSNSNDTLMIAAALSTAFAPNYLRCVQGEIKKSRTSSEKVWYKMINGGRARISKESVNILDALDLNSPSWLTFFHKMRSADSGLMLVRDTSAVPGIAIPLLAGKNIKINQIYLKEQHLINGIDNPVELCIDDNSMLRFICSRELASSLVSLRQCLASRFDQFLSDITNATNSSSPIEWSKEDEVLLKLLKKCLLSSSEKNRIIELSPEVVSETNACS